MKFHDEWADPWYTEFDANKRPMWDEDTKAMDYIHLLFQCWGWM